MSESKDAASASPTPWCPPPVIEDLFAATAGNQFSAINRPTAGPRDDKDVPVGPAPLQLYSLGTPNGHKVSILLEELCELGLVTYDAWTVNIGKGEQFSKGFTEVNPNGKIPALTDKEGPDGKPIHVFESAAIDLYLCEKYDGGFLPRDVRSRTEVMNWIFWQMGGQGPMTGQFGHFFVYAPADKKETRDYGVARYGMEVQRLCDVLDKALAGKTYLVGEKYSLADIICFPWFLQVMRGYPHASGIKACEFLSVTKYTNAIAWAERIKERPAVQRGLQVNGFTSPNPKPWLEQKKEEEK